MRTGDEEDNQGDHCWWKKTTGAGGSLELIEAVSNKQLLARCQLYGMGQHLPFATHKEKYNKESNTPVCLTLFVLSSSYCGTLFEFVCVTSPGWLNPVPSSGCWSSSLVVSLRHKAETLQPEIRVTSPKNVLKC
jgi:hypothetical protein